MPDYAFPRELLEQPAEARLAYFRSFTIAHPLLKAADAAMKQAIREPAGWSLIFVYGPTGVGKTTLRQRVEKHLTNRIHDGNPSSGPRDHPGSQHRSRGAGFQPIQLEGLLPESPHGLG